MSHDLVLWSIGIVTGAIVSYLEIAGYSPLSQLFVSMVVGAVSFALARCIASRIK